MISWKVGSVQEKIKHPLVEGPSEIINTAAVRIWMLWSGNCSCRLWVFDHLLTIFSTQSFSYPSLIFMVFPIGLASLSGHLSVSLFSLSTHSRGPPAFLCSCLILLLLLLKGDSQQESSYPCCWLNFVIRKIILLASQAKCCNPHYYITTHQSELAHQFLFLLYHFFFI